MKKIFIERNIVVFLFVVVLVIFSFADRDTQKLESGYTTGWLLEKATPDFHATAANIAIEIVKNN